MWHVSSNQDDSPTADEVQSASGWLTLWYVIGHDAAETGDVSRWSTIKTVKPSLNRVCEDSGNMFRSVIKQLGFRKWHCEVNSGVFSESFVCELINERHKLGLSHFPDDAPSDFHCSCLHFPIKQNKRQKCRTDSFNYLSWEMSQSLHIWSVLPSNTVLLHFHSLSQLFCVFLANSQWIAD